MGDSDSKPPAQPERGDSDGRPGTAPTSNRMSPSVAKNILDLAIHDPDAPPKHIGQYRVLKRLGRGGMGVVYLATRNDDQIQRHVAIKLIRFGLGDADDGGAGVIKRFELERQVLSALNHPNIARVLDAGRHEGRPYFVMEYVEGEPIDEYCDRMQLTTEERLRLFRKVCDAVQYAHQNLVIHRDIKPSNILVDAKGEPKLMDFGIAKLTNPDMAGQAMATTGEHAPMTPEYASPEQVLGKPLGTTSDIYSLGVLLYELVTGRRPYRLKSRAMAEMIRVICEEEPERPSTSVTHGVVIEAVDGTTRTLTAESLAKPREGAPSRLRRKLAGDVDNIVLMAMRKAPARRYQSAQAMGEDIERHLSGNTVRACPETVWYVASKFVARNKVAVIATGLVLASIVAGGTVAAVSWRREKAAREAEQAARERESEAKHATVGLAKEYIGGISKMVSAQEQSTPALVGIAEATLKTIQARESAFGDEPETRGLLASTYELFAKVSTGLRGGGTGKLEEAMAAIVKAEALRREEYQRSKNSPTAAAALGVALVYKGDVLRLTKETTKAQAAYEEASTLIEAAAAQKVADSATARLLALTLTIRGEFLERNDQRVDAGALHKRSLDLRRQNADKYKDPIFVRDVTVGLDRYGRWLIGNGQRESGLAMLNEAVESREKTMKVEATARAQRDWAVAVSALARAHADNEIPPPDSISRDCERAVRVTGFLIEGELPSARAFADHARALADLGREQGRRESLESSVSSLTRAVDIFEQSLRASPTNTDLRYELCETLLWLGDAQQSAGKSTDSSRTFRRGLELLGEPEQSEGAWVSELRTKLERARDALR